MASFSSRETESKALAQRDEISSVVTSIVNKYWIGYPSYVTDSYIKRHVFEIGLLLRSLGDIKDKSVVDVGGGWGLFAASCSALGMKSTLVEDFGDPGKSDTGDPRQSLPDDYGVTVMHKDVIKEGFGLPPDSIDAFTTFDMVEHLHASPKQLFHDAMKALRTNGLFLLGVPNSVNLRKRITVPLGKGNWSHFPDWYEKKVFRGHVREPDVHDLKKIAQDISLSEYKILGRNWLSYMSQRYIIRTASKIAERTLNLFPSLCSNLYLLGWKQQDYLPELVNFRTF